MGNHLPAALEAVHLATSDVPNLVSSMERSHKWIEKARMTLREELGDTEGLDVVAFGSLARREVTEASDLDFLVVEHTDSSHPKADHAITAADNLRQVLEDDTVVNAPGSSQLFGGKETREKFVKDIGLQEDSNHSLSRRILFLEESVSLLKPNLHAELMRRVIARYLEARPGGASGLPRFLLNDLARYWRTISVDYQAKTPATNPYSLRYLKLIIPRKLTYAASIAPLFLAGDNSPNDLEKMLVDMFELPPVLRFLKFIESTPNDVEVVTAGQRSVEILELFNGRAGDAEWRQQIARECALTNPLTGTAFGEMRSLGRELQQQLEAIFFSESHRELSQRYLVF